LRNFKNQKVSYTKS